MSRFYFFGYGSLVNSLTRPADSPFERAELKGWRRVWTVIDDGFGGLRCVLSVVEDSNSSIYGIVANEPLKNLPSLNRREHNYRRLTINNNSLTIDGKQNVNEIIYIYQAHKPPLTKISTLRYPIFQSYLDVVLSGYYSHWRNEGVHHFLNTTDGWDMPILDDRHSPRYTRAVELAEATRATIDEQFRNWKSSYA